MRTRDVVVTTYTEALTAFWGEAQSYLEQLAEGATIHDPRALDLFMRYYALRVSFTEEQLPDLIVLSWVPPEASVALQPEGLLALQQDIDHVRVAVGFLLGN